MTLFQWIGVFSIFALVIHIMAHACTETAKQMTPPFSNIFRQIGPKILGLPQVKFNCKIPPHDKQGYGNGAGRNRCHWNFQTFQRCNCLWPSDECLKSPSCLKSPYSTVSYYRTLTSMHIFHNYYLHNEYYAPTMIYPSPGLVSYLLSSLSAGNISSFI